MNSNFKYLFVFSVLFYTMSFAQMSIEKPDFEDIKKEIQNKSGKYCLSTLLKRYNSSETNFTIEELQYLYYGYRVSNTYSPLAASVKANEIMNLKAKKNNCNSVIETCNQALKKDIFDLDYYNIKMQCMHELNPANNDSDKGFNFYYNLCKAIRNTGTGSKKTEPIYVISENHFDFVLNLMGLEKNGRIVKDELTHYVEVKNNSFNNKGVYFYLIDINNYKENTEELNVATIVSNQKHVEKNETILASSESVYQSNLSTPVATEKQDVTNSGNKIQSIAKIEVLDKKEAIIAERNRKLQERQEAHKKLIEDKIEARNRLLEEKKLLRERLLQQRQQQLSEKAQ